MLGGLYTLPAGWLQGATPAGSVTASAAPRPPTPTDTTTSPGSSNPLTTGVPESVTTTHPSASWREAGATCIACGIGVGTPGFASAEEQRAHFKTDWHRFNVRRRLAGKQPPLSAEQFEALLLEESGSDVSSISGGSSPSSASDEGSQGEDGEGRGGGGGVRRHRREQPGVGEEPKATFRTSDGRPFCVWRCLLERDHVRGGSGAMDDDVNGPPAAERQLAELQRLHGVAGVFVVVLLRGGHFAAAVFRRKPTRASSSSGAAPPASGAPAARPPDVLEVVAHKTFHRYVVRAKAGGKQSSKDATGKYAKSAGSALRRYNEAALDNDIAELLGSWRQYLDAATLIFVQAPASNARSIFAAAAQGGDRVTLPSGVAGAPRALLNPADPRVRRIPFVTQRPTFTEAWRVIGLLMAVFEPAVGGAQAAAQAAADAAAERRAARAAERRERQERKAAAKAAGRPAPDQAAQGSKGLAGIQEPPPAHPEEETALHTASRTGDSKAVARLLVDHDPAARDSWGRTPYAVAGSKEVRDAFRRHMGAAPGQWDYAAAGVPSPLTDELQAAQAAKKAEKRARQKAREKERKEVDEEARAAAEAAAKAAISDEIARAAAEAASLAAKLNVGGSRAAQQLQASGRGGGGGRGGQVGGARGRTIGGRGGAAAAAAATTQQQQQAAPTPEELARRREVMAAAAEARARALQQAAQSQRLY